MANIQHPEDLEQYIPVEDRKIGEIFELSEEDKEKWPNGRTYERFTITGKYEENYAVPLRPGIVAEYVENDLGYLIQQTEDGFRYIGIELGEEDVFGNFYSSKRAALQAAVSDWRENGQGDDWGNWSRQMAEDSKTMGPLVDVATIVSVLIEEIGSCHGDEELNELAAKIVARLNG